MCLTSTQNNFVVNVSNIHYVGDVKRKKVFENTTNNIKREIGTCMSQMAAVVNCWSANIEFDMVAFDGRQFTFGICKRIINHNTSGVLTNSMVTCCIARAHCDVWFFGGQYDEFEIDTSSHRVFRYLFEPISLVHTISLRHVLSLLYVHWKRIDLDCT